MKLRRQAIHRSHFTITGLITVCLLLLSSNARPDSLFDEYESYRHEIETVKLERGRLDPSLILMLTRLGSLACEDADYDQAIDIFQEAQHISHRTHGVSSLEQLEIIDQIIGVYIKTNNIEPADSQQQFYYYLNLQNYGENDVRLLPAMIRLGDWQRRRDKHFDALVTYENAIRLIDNLKFSQIDLPQVVLELYLSNLDRKRASLVLLTDNLIGKVDWFSFSSVDLSRAWIVNGLYSATSFQPGR